MKPILMLGPARSGGGSVERWRIELCEATAAEAMDPTAYSAVVVVNDGGSLAAQRLLAACEMRDRQRGLRIGVLSYVDEEDRSSPPDVEPRLSIELSKEEGVRLEYQAV